MQIKPGSEEDIHRMECDECAKMTSEMIDVSLILQKLEKTPAPAGFDAKLKERIAAEQKKKQEMGSVNKFINVLLDWLSPMPRRFAYAPIVALIALLAIMASMNLPQTAQQTVSKSDYIDWSYIQACRNAHAGIIPTEPLADNSAAILKSGGLLVSKEL